MIEDIGILAKDILKTIEREDAFFEAKKQGGFVKSFKAKEVLNEDWSSK